MVGKSRLHIRVPTPFSGREGSLDGYLRCFQHVTEQTIWQAGNNSCSGEVGSAEKVIRADHNAGQEKKGMNWARNCMTISNQFAGRYEDAALKLTLNLPMEDGLCSAGFMITSLR